MPPRSEIDFSDDVAVAEWRLVRLRRVGRIYAAVCFGCAATELWLGLEILAWIYAFNASVLASFTLSLTLRNHATLERFSIVIVHVTCMAGVFATGALANVCYVACLMCATCLHEHDLRWQRFWNVTYLLSLLSVAGFFLSRDPAPGLATDLYHNLIPLGCSVIVVGFIIHDYASVSRQAFAGHAELNEDLVARIALARHTSAELEEQLAARQRVSRSIAQSIANVHLTHSRLEASHEQLEQFAYAASHDLKEPVRTIRSFMQMARRKLSVEAAADATLAEHFDYIESNAHAMHNVLERLLIYSRASRVEAVAKTCALQRIWLAAVAKSALPAELKQTHLATLATSETVLVEVDAGKLQAVFAELLDNASRFVAAGAVPVLHIEIDPPSGGEVTCRLRDEGIGIEAEYLGQVFGLFKRLHPREEYPSAGVGLALVKRLLEQIGGTIAIESEPGVGTTVEVTVPAGPY